MVFLVQIKKKKDGNFEKGTSEYIDDKEAIKQLYVAMASAMNNADTQSIMCMITDEFGSQKKKEYWVEPEVEEIVEEG